jgi:hypothetical protein
MNALEKYAAKRMLVQELRKNASILSTLARYGRVGATGASRIASRVGARLGKLKTKFTGIPNRALSRSRRQPDVISSMFTLPRDVRGYLNTFAWQRNMPLVRPTTRRSTYPFTSGPAKSPIPDSRRLTLREGYGVDPLPESYLSGLGKEIPRGRQLLEQYRPSKDVNPLIARRQYLKRIGLGTSLPAAYAAHGALT